MRVYEEIRTNKWSVILVDVNTCETSKKGVFAAGDAITGGSTVIQAMGQAKKAAAAIHEYLMQIVNREVTATRKATIE